MRIAFYAPFKPLDHAHPSGDLVIADGLWRYLKGRGHHLRVAAALRARWLFWRPWLWHRLLRDRRRALRDLDVRPSDLWLTYHCYYKAPDLIGPWVAGRTGRPYVIFQGIYATKRRRDIRTWPGFFFNTRALCAAQHVFSNRLEDHRNLGRLLPAERLTYVPPGIFPGDFKFDGDARARLRKRWGAGNDPVVLSAAMFRPGVKSDGLMTVIRACAALVRRGRRLLLGIAGDGRERERLEGLARRLLPGRVRFTGQISRAEMFRFYSAGDVFAFPGIRESLGMVYLEAQSCGLPVVAYDNGGIPEVVDHDATGLLVPAHDRDAFADRLGLLIEGREVRRRMGRAAAAYVRRAHDLDTNYRLVESVLLTIAGGRRGLGRSAAWVKGTKFKR